MERYQQSVSKESLGRLEEAFYSAEAMLGKKNPVHASFESYAGLKAKVQLRNGTITAKVSDGFENAEREVLVGLALTLLGGMFKRKMENGYTHAYKEFASRESTSGFHDTLRKLRGRGKKLEPHGRHHDLSKNKSRRVLGFHDGAFNSITINRILDSDRVPSFVVQYVVFHELLHCKHKVLFQRGESMRRTIHPKAFKDDEQRFPFAEKANDWLQRNL